MNTVDMKLEVVAIPVSDIERAKRFYGNELGWRLDADFVDGSEFRGIQFTPPGSQCSIHFGKGVTQAQPGSLTGLLLIVSDIQAAHAELVDRGIAVSKVFHRAGPGKPAVEGVDPERHSYSSFATFKDPDGNTWVLQEVTTRLPGRVDTNNATYSSANDLAAALRRAEAGHGVYETEKLHGVRDAEWPNWYAAYMIAEAAGKPLPT